MTSKSSSPARSAKTKVGRAPGAAAKSLETVSGLTRSLRSLTEQVVGMAGAAVDTSLAAATGLQAAAGACAQQQERRGDEQSHRGGEYGRPAGAAAHQADHHRRQAEAHQHLQVEDDGGGFEPLGGRDLPQRGQPRRPEERPGQAAQERGAERRRHAGRQESRHAGSPWLGNSSRRCAPKPAPR